MTDMQVRYWAVQEDKRKNDETARHNLETERQKSRELNIANKRMIAQNRADMANTFKNLVAGGTGMYSAQKNAALDVLDLLTGSTVLQSYTKPLMGGAGSSLASLAATLFA